LEQEHTKHSESMDGESSRLLERERKAGVLEGQVSGLSEETSALRQRVAELQARLREAESKSGQEKSEGVRLRQELEKAHADVQTAKVEVDSHQRALLERREQEKAKLREAPVVNRKGSRLGCGGFRGKRGQGPDTP